MRLTSRIYSDAIILGPYFDKSLGRNVVNIQRGTKRGNMTYARFLMQEHLGRKLLSDEHVDHKDDIKIHDWIENLQILDPPANTRKTKGEITFFEFTCPECNGPGMQRLSHVRHNRDMGKAGPFCGRSCAGKYSQKIQAQVAQRQEARR